jgi:hypothetical protein
MTNGEIKRGTTERSSNQDMPHGLLKAKATLPVFTGGALGGQSKPLHEQIMIRRGVHDIHALYRVGMSAP